VTHARRTAALRGRHRSGRTAVCFAFAAVRHVGEQWVLEVCSTHAAHGSAENGTLGVRDARPGRNNSARKAVETLLAAAGGNKRKALEDFKLKQALGSFSGITRARFVRVAATVQSAQAGTPTQRQYVKQLTCQESFLEYAKQHPYSFSRHVLAAKYVGAPETVRDAQGHPVEVPVDASYLFVASPLSISLLVRAYVILGDMCFNGS